MLFSAVVDTSRRVASTRSRVEKRNLLARCLRDAGATHAALAVSYLTGALPQGRIGLGPSMLRELGDVAVSSAAGLRLADVDEAFTRIGAIAGAGSAQRRRDALAALLARATADEQDFLRRLILGELRQGALESVLVDAMAEAASLPPADVRRAVMLAGAAPPVARAALADGAAGLARFRLSPLSPVQPMLAQPADGVDQAMAALGDAAIEYKLDGARVQVHKAAGTVRVFSRGLADVTDRVPEIVDAVQAMPARELILDGETLALRDGARPLPFQVTMRRFGRSSEVATARTALPLSVFFFDCLHRDGDDLIDRSARERFAALSGVAAPAMRVPRIETTDPARAAAFLAQALDAGHEGVMAKSLASAYAAGSRGAGWLKLKQAHTLDLVVLAAEWGSGRRRGRLSNLHLGARHPNGGFVMLGKTFKGLTDAMLEWQTTRLLALQTAREGNVVHVRPELVVEIALSDVQASPHYPAGMALRFARVKRYREDKHPEQADTVDTVRALHRLGGGVELAG